MKTLIVFLMIFAATSARSYSNISELIFGGVNAIPGEFPFMVSVTHFWLGGDHVCGGVILSDTWILTAAHCFTETSTRGNIDALAGRHNIGTSEATEQRTRIERNRWLIHPNWNPGREWGPNDIALGRLTTPLVFNDRVRPIRIPQPNVPPSGPGMFMGWGATSNGILAGPSDILQKVMFSTISQEACVEAINSNGGDGSIIDDSKFCTGPLTGGFSVCRGDFGGPMVQGTAPNEVVVGIASWGFRPCGTRGAPTGVFTTVSSFSSWITANTGVNP